MDCIITSADLITWRGPLLVSVDVCACLSVCAVFVSLFVVCISV